MVQIALGATPHEATTRQSTMQTSHIKAPMGLGKNLATTSNIVGPRSDARCIDAHLMKYLRDAAKALRE